MMQYRKIMGFVLWFAVISLTGCSHCHTSCPTLSCCPMASCCRSGPVSIDYVGGCPKVCCCPVRKKIEPTCLGHGKDRLRNELAAEGVQVVEVGDLVTIILFTDNCFETGTANINECCYPTMNNILKLINSYGCPYVRITGYTDHVGDYCSKWDLSRHLANSVMSYFWAHGIALERLSATGCACNNPIASPHTVCGNAYNRRVEINLCRNG